MQGSPFKFGSFFNHLTLISNNLKVTERFRGNVLMVDHFHMTMTQLKMFSCQPFPQFSLKVSWIETDLFSPHPPTIRVTLFHVRKYSILKHIWQYRSKPSKFSSTKKFNKHCMLTHGFLALQPLDVFLCFFY